MKIDLKREGQELRKSPAMTPGHFEKKPQEIIREAPSLNMSSKEYPIPKILDWVIFGAVYLLVFLMPIFFLPVVPSILELNKQFLLIIIGGVAFLAWIGKLAWDGKIRVKKNFLLVPILLLILILALNTAFAIYRDQSMWGALGTESLSLVSFIGLIAFLLVINNNLNSSKKIKYLVLLFFSP
ncbi:MAG: hypothetical protein QXO70_00475 [Candidatus Pacearchaeota archaeon]